MKSRRAAAVTITLFTIPLTAATPAGAQALDTFGVLAGSEITNTGPTVINGNVGLSPGSAITGAPSVTAPYATYVADGVAMRAKADLTTAYNVLAGRPTTMDLTGVDLGAATRTAGVYNFDTSAGLASDLILDGENNPDAVFIFNIGSTLTTASDSRVLLTNGANPNNVFFRVGSSATLGTTTDFQGRILALTSITLENGVDISCGAALARNGAVTLDTNRISVAEPLLPLAPETDPPDEGMYVACPMIEVVIGDELDETAPDNAQDVADVIDDYVDNGGDLPLGFEVLDLLTPAELADALAQMSGEVATGVVPTGTQAMDSLLDTVINQGVVGDSVSEGPGGRDQTGPRRGTVKALGYAQKSGLGAALAPDSRRWGTWAAVYGSDANVDGDAAAGTRDRSSDNYGVVVGLDYYFTENTKVGLALSGGETGFDLANGGGHGSSTVFQGAIYGHTDFDPAYISAALAYAYHDQATDRTTTFDGARYTADFAASNIAGHVEAGYHLGAITPYGAMRVQIFHTPDYSEISDTGAFALNYEEQTTTTARTELGTRLQHTLELNDGASLTLRGRIAWAHDFSEPSTNATFRALPGSESFTVNGAAAERDSLLLSAGAEIMMASGFSLAGWFDSELDQSSQTYGGNARIRYEW